MTNSKKNTQPTHPDLVAHQQLHQPVVPETPPEKPKEKSHYEHLLQEPSDDTKSHLEQILAQIGNIEGQAESAEDLNANSDLNDLSQYNEDRLYFAEKNDLLQSQSGAIAPTIPGMNSENSAPQPSVMPSPALETSAGTVRKESLFTKPLSSTQSVSGSLALSEKITFSEDDDVDYSAARDALEGEHNPVGQQIAALADKFAKALATQEDQDTQEILSSTPVNEQSDQQIAESDSVLPAVQKFIHFQNADLKAKTTAASNPDQAGVPKAEQASQTGRVKSAPLSKFLKAPKTKLLNKKNVIKTARPSADSVDIAASRLSAEIAEIQKFIKYAETKFAVLDQRISEQDTSGIDPQQIAEQAAKLTTERFLRLERTLNHLQNRSDRVESDMRAKLGDIDQKLTHMFERMTVSEISVSNGSTDNRTNEPTIPPRADSLALSTPSSNPADANASPLSDEPELPKPTFGLDGAGATTTSTDALSIDDVRAQINAEFKEGDVPAFGRSKPTYSEQKSYQKLRDEIEKTTINNGDSLKKKDKSSSTKALWRYVLLSLVAVMMGLAALLFLGPNKFQTFKSLSPDLRKTISGSKVQSSNTKTPSRQQHNDQSTKTTDKLAIQSSGNKDKSALVRANNAQNTPEQLASIEDLINDPARQNLVNAGGAGSTIKNDELKVAQAVTPRTSAVNNGNNPAEDIVTQSILSGATTKSMVKGKVPKMEIPPATLGPYSLRKAAVDGDPKAQFEIATRYANGSGAERDYNKAVHWYMQSASKAYAPAQYRLATLYERGHGVEKNYARARVWYERAAELGNVKAMHNLAVLGAGNEAGKPDYLTAVYWFNEAAKRNLADSQFNLAVLYQTGLGVKRNEIEAYKWLSLAARQGDVGARKRLALLAKVLKPADLAKAQELIRKWKPLEADNSSNDVSGIERYWTRLVPVNSLSVIERSRITTAQILLKTLGFQISAADGELNDETVAAVKAFQKQKGLEETGQINDDLVQLLNQSAI